MSILDHENIFTRKFCNTKISKSTVHQVLFFGAKGQAALKAAIPSWSYVYICIYVCVWNSLSLSRSWDTWTREWKWCVACMCPSTYCPIVRASLDLDKGVGVIKCYCTMYILRITQHRWTCDRPVCLISHCHLPSFFSQLWPVWPCLQKLPLR